MILYPIFFGLLGLALGSFLNVCIDRLPGGESLVHPPSRCPACQRRLKPGELIPGFSYLLLRGRCRDCGEKIPLRVLLVELGTGLLFVLLWYRLGFTWNLLVVSLYALALIPIAVIDLEHQRIPNLLVYPALVLSMLMIPLLHRGEMLSFLGGGLVGFSLLFVISVLAPSAMGFGDVKLAAFLGLAVGFPEIAVLFILAFILGGLSAGIMLALKVVGRKDTIAFGPYLALAGMIMLLYGSQILEWWTRRLGL